MKLSLMRTRTLFLCSFIAINNWGLAQEVNDTEPSTTVEEDFVPERGLEVIAVKNKVNNTEQIIEDIGQRAQQVRSQFLEKYREKLNRYVASKKADSDSSIDESIKKYEAVLRNDSDHPFYAPEALYRLGIYYYEKDEAIYFDKLAKYSQAREQGDEDFPFPEEDFSRTINALETLIKKFPNFQHMDAVYYLLGLSLWYEGVFYEAVDNFQTLLKRFPRSRYVAEVWFRLGEFFYDMDQFDDAIKAYQNLASDRESRFYDKALYKIAWSHFQRDRYRLAIENFVKVLELTYLEKGEGEASAMRAEVTRYIVKSFSEELSVLEAARPIAPFKSDDASDEYVERMGVRLVDRIIDYFTGKNKAPYLKYILLEAAAQLVNEVKINAGVKALEKIIELDPLHRDNPKISAQIASILESVGREEEAREKNRQLLRVYGQKSQWYRSKASDVLAKIHAREAVRDAMLSLAVYHHKRAKELSGDKTYGEAKENLRRAASLYLDYIQLYPERDDIHQAILYFAEVSLALKRYRDALDGYQLLKDYPLPLPKNFRTDATYNIVSTFRHVLEDEMALGRFKSIDFNDLSAEDRGQEVEEIPELGKKYILIIDEFLTMAPDDPAAPVVSFHAAAIYYAYGHIGDAQRRFFAIIERYSASQAAVASGRLIIEDAMARNDWPQVIELSKNFATQDLGGKKKEFERIEGNARFKAARAVFTQAIELDKMGQLIKAKEKYQEAASLFSQLLMDDPASPYADVMLFNAARALAQSGTVTAALPLYRRLYTEYPDSTYAKTAMFQEALALEKMLKFSQAAMAYDAIIALYGVTEDAQGALLNKALLFEAAGDSLKAASAYLEFAKKFPTAKEGPAALLQAASIYKGLGRTGQQITMLEQFIKQYRNDADRQAEVIEAHVQVADTLGELEQKASSQTRRAQYRKARMDHYRSAVSLYRSQMQSPFAAYYAAKAQTALLAPEFDAFLKMGISARASKAQGAQLTAMMKKLSDISQKHEAVIRTYAQPAWNAKSLYRIGALYEHLAKSLINAQCPSDVARMDEFACDEYLVLLEDKAAILEEKALDAFKQAYDIALSAHDVPSDLLADIQKGLSALRPGQYQRVGKAIFSPAIKELFGQGRMLSTGQMASTLPGQADDLGVVVE